MANNSNEKKYNLRNLTIWVGAGISIKTPSKLPSGNELTEFAFSNMILGKDKFFEVWEQINFYERTCCDVNVTKFPRLELLLSSIAYIEKYFMGMGSLKGKFLEGLNAFDEVPFNDNHMLLAAFAHAGARIMTANFDLGIERAYRKLYAEECNNVIHFHGTNLSGDKIGATIENITHFVDKTMDKKVKSSFYNEHSNYFYGYSFSDMYDINTAIYELYSNPDRNYTKDNWVCNHNGGDDKLKDKAVNTFVEEDNIHVFEAETTEELKKLCIKYSVAIPQQVGKTEITNDRNWAELFLEKVEITEEFKVLSTIHFFNRVGIAVDRVDMNILKKYEQMELNNSKKEIIEYHLAANSQYWYKRYGNSRLETEYHKQELNKRQVSSKLNGDLQENYSLQGVDEILQSLYKKDFVRYEDFSELSKRMNRIKFRLILKGEYIGDKDARYLIEEFLRYRVGKFIEINLYASTYRYKMLLDGIEGKENWKIFKRANEIYYDIGNVDGIVSTRLDFLISHNYKQNADEWDLIFHSQEWNELKRLCKCAGSYRYEQLMNQYEVIKKAKVQQ